MGIFDRFRQNKKTEAGQHKTGPLPAPKPISSVSASQIATGGSAVCDVCNRVLRSREGYCLTTRQVVTAQGYWAHTFTHAWGYLGTIDPEARTLLMIVMQQASQELHG